MDEREIFLEAIEIPVESRSQWLDERIGKDSPMRMRLDSLLANHTPGSSFLEEPDHPEQRGEPITFDSDVASTVAAQVTQGAQQAKADKPGTDPTASEADSRTSNIQIGQFKLLQKIGEGGFGIVYVAEQSAPVRRKVAFKLIKRGMETREIVARFEAERQALAMMDHPHIAQVYDGGETETGHPFFVMELVRGISITDYCAKNRLSTDERLKLFSQVCDAIQHAHQKGVIHRDIKPGNVLVGQSGGKAIPKVIDFGVSKAINQPLTNKTIYTQQGQFVGTPQYMSPEQAGLMGLDVDTRSDVYSLGVLLYELLVGQTPLEPRRLRRASVAELQRIVTDEEATRPSAHANLDSFRHATNETGTQLRRRFKGEIDWIVMKALEKDRRRRYETAAELGADIHRHLNGEAVLAGPPSTVYQLSKFISKNRKIAASLAFALVSLTIGFSLALFGFLQARYDRQQLTIANQEITEQAVAAQRASEEAARLKTLAETRATEAVKASNQATRLSDALSELIATAHPKAVSDSEVTAKELLDNYVRWLDDKLLDAPEVKSDILFSLGKAYLQMGNEISAAPCLAECIRLRREALGPGSEKLADALVDYALATRTVTPAREAIRIMETKPPGPLTVKALRWLAWGLALGMDGQGKEEEAIKTAEQGLAVANALDEAVDPNLMAGLHEALADALTVQGQFEEAFLHAESAVAILEEIPEQSIGVAWAATRAAIALNGAREFDEAVRYSKTAVELFEKFSVDQALANGLSYLALSYANSGQYELAIENYEKSATLRAGAGFTQMAITTYGDAGDLADAQGNTELARQLFRRATELEIPRTNPNQCYAQLRLTEISGAKGNLQSLGERLRYSQQLIDASEGKMEAERIRLCRARNYLMQDSIDLESTQQLGREILDLTENSIDRNGMRSGAFSILARCDVLAGRLGEAEEKLVQIPNMLTYSQFHQFLSMLPAEQAIADALQAAGDTASLERVLRWGVSVREQYLPKNDFQLALARERLVRFFSSQNQGAAAAELAQSAMADLDSNGLVDRQNKARFADLAVSLQPASEAQAD